MSTISRLLKIYVFFVECSLLFRALLQKRPIILRSLLIVATPQHSATPCNTLHHIFRYGVATVSRIDEITGLLCRILSLYRALLQKRHIILSILLTEATP